MRTGFDQDMNMEETDVWIGHNSHPGTKDFRRAIRFAVEIFEDEEFSKKVWKSIKKDLKGRRFFQEKQKELILLERDDIMQCIAGAFEDEKERRWASRSKRSKQEEMKEKSDDKLSLAEDEDPESGGWRKRLENMSYRMSCVNSRGLVGKEKSRIQGSEKDMDRNVYIGNERETGTKELLDNVRRIAEKHPNFKFSNAIFDAVMRGFENRQFYWSIKSHQEVSTEDLWLVIKQLWKMDVYMLQARPADVYFAVSSHPGTRAWVRSTQQVILAYGECEYSRFIYKEIVRRLYLSKFYVGRPPDCDEATTKERARMLRRRYEMEKEVWARIQRKRKASVLAEMKIKVASGNLKPKHVSAMRQDASIESSQDEYSSHHHRRQKLPVFARAIPGNLYWFQLSRCIKNSRMIGRIRNSEANCMSKVTFFAPQMCCPRFRETFIWILGADCRKWRQFVEKDIPSGEDVFNRLHKHLLMTVFGYTTAAPALVLLTFLVSLLVCVGIHSIIKGILFRLLAANENG